jgi:hypothetical protein
MAVIVFCCRLVEALVADDAPNLQRSSAAYPAGIYKKIPIGAGQRPSDTSQNVFHTL